MHFAPRCSLIYLRGTRCRRSWTWLLPAMALAAGARPKSAAIRTFNDPFSVIEQQQQAQQAQQPQPQPQAQRRRKKAERISPFTRRPSTASGRARRRPGTAEHERPGTAAHAAVRGSRIRALDFSPTTTAVSAENEGAWRRTAVHRHPANADLTMRLGKQGSSRQQQPALGPSYHSTPDIGLIRMQAGARGEPVARVGRASPAARAAAHGSSKTELSIQQPTLDVAPPATSGSRLQGPPGRVRRTPSAATRRPSRTTVFQNVAAGESSAGIRPQSAGGLTVGVAQLELDIDTAPDSTALESSLTDWVGSTVRIPYGLHSPAAGGHLRGAQLSFSEGDDLAVRLPPDPNIAEWTQELNAAGGRDLSAERYANTSTATVGLSDVVQQQFNLLLHNDVLQQARLGSGSAVSVRPALPAPTKRVAELTFSGPVSPPADIGAWQLDRGPVTPGIENSPGGPSSPVAGTATLSSLSAMPSPEERRLLHAAAEESYQGQSRTGWATPSPQQQASTRGGGTATQSPPASAGKTDTTSLERPLQTTGAVTGWLPSEYRQAVGSMRLRSHPLTPPVQRVAGRG
jgi:hypothetical protein